MQDKMLPATNTLPDLLLTVTALAGELPVSLLSRLPGANSYKEFALKRLKRDKLLRTYYSDGLRGLRLTAHAKRLLLATYPDRFLRCFTGDTATNATKPATLETGAEIKVPLFIDEGEMIKIDTRTGEYLSRA